MTTRERLKESLETQLKTVQRQLAVLEKFPELDQLTFPASFYTSSQVDFDNLTHERVIEVIKVVGGKWDKEPGDDGTVHYSTEKDGVIFRCWRGQPPPNCKIVEVLETIPAQPERTIIKRKLVCQ